MIQKHNRHMSFSLYISVLAASDTVSLLIGRSNLKTFHTPDEIGNSYKNTTKNPNKNLPPVHIRLGTAVTSV